MSSLIDFHHLLPLQIFPGALASSVITTVWVGIFVVALFNLRFGWVMSGLIVPGYLVPLLIIKPSAALVVLVEGSITYALVWFYSEWLSQRMLWSRFFGRDRFFVLVLVSVAVRIVGDGYALPMLGEYLDTHWQITFDYQNNLHSFGLIIAALVANNFWKTGFSRGLFAMVVTIGLTYCIVRFGLMEYTNFSMSNIGFLYEDMASGFLASPKSYIILLITAFIASRMNLYYGWDYSGILIPSLLALQWFEPQKILMSFLEAIVILLLAQQVLRAPLFKRITVEGARKMLLFFNISFAWKMLLAWAIMHWWPSVKVSDYFGFGYLLPTLMALKMHDKGIFARMSVAIVQTSLGASAIAAVIGFALALVPDPLPLLQSRQIQGAEVHPMPFSGKALDLLLAQKQQVYQSLTLSQIAKPTPLQAQAFDAALHLLQQDGLSAAQLDAVARLLYSANYELHQNGAQLLLLERAPQRFWGSYLINSAAKRHLLIEVPLPVDEAGTLEAAAMLFEQTGARVLAVAGAARHASRDGSADVLNFPNTPYQAFHRAFARNNTLQVRADATVGSGSLLRIKGEIPADLPLASLQQQLGNPRISWQAAPGMNVQRDSVASGFAELVFNPHDLQRMLVASHGAQAQLASVQGQIGHWLLQDKSRFAATGSNLYHAPTAGELIYLDKDVLTPLAGILREARGSTASAFGGSMAGSNGGLAALTQKMQLRLQAVNLAAQAMGYELTHFTSEDQSQYLILAERGSVGNPASAEGADAAGAQGAQRPLAGAAIQSAAAPAGGATSVQTAVQTAAQAAVPRRYWGSYVFRLGGAQSWLVQVPRPYFEPNSLELGIALFERMQGAAIAMAGASPLANQDHGADLLAYENKANLLNLVSQVMLRESGSQPVMTLQARAMPQRPNLALPESDLVLSFADGALQPGHASRLGKQVLGQLQQSGFSLQLADGSARMAEYGTAAAAQTLYQSTARNKELALVFASPLANPLLRQQSLPTAQNMQFKALNLQTGQASLVEKLATSTAASTSLPAALRTQLDNYLQKQDVVLLADLQQQYPLLRFEYLVDQGTHRGYLLLWQRDALAKASGEQWLAVLNLSAKDPARVQALQAQQAFKPQAREFIGKNMTWWLARSAS